MPLLEPLILLGGAAVIFALGFFAGKISKAIAARRAADEAWKMATTFNTHKSGESTRL